MSEQNAVVKAMDEVADQGVAAYGKDSIPGRRLVEMRDFYSYLWRELPALIDRWQPAASVEGGKTERGRAHGRR